MLDESALVLEGVTLAQVVELVVEVLVDLAGGTVADEQATENTHAAHPEESAVERRYPSAHQIPSQKGKNHIFLVYRLIDRKKNGGRASVRKSKKGVLHTWAYEPPWYPYAYPDRGFGRFCGPR